MSKEIKTWEELIKGELDHLQDLQKCLELLSCFNLNIEEIIEILTFKNLNSGCVKRLSNPKLKIRELKEIVDDIVKGE